MAHQVVCDACRKVIEADRPGSLTLREEQADIAQPQVVHVADLCSSCFEAVKAIVEKFKEAAGKSAAKR